MKKAAIPRPKFFEWSDAWVFASLAGTVDDSGVVDFARLIACGDMLNHAIFEAREIRQAMVKLHQRGLVDVRENGVLALPIAEELLLKIRGMRGGLFSIPNNALKVLNSPKSNLPVIDHAPSVSFITSEFVRRAYKRYGKLFSKSRA